MKTLRITLEEAVARLSASGVESPRVDAEVLLAHALGRSRTYLYAHLPDAVPPDAGARFEALLRRRESREPLPYVLGIWEWLGLPFRVSPAVLIPRPETETLVEEVARRLDPGARVLDVGAGSGCISIGIARLAPGSSVTALELSETAAALARDNVERLGLAERVTVIRGAFPAALPEGEFDALVSNPPYIPSREVDELPPELREHEPRLALDGGADGLDVLRLLARHGLRCVRPGGLLALETALGQPPSVIRLLREAGGWEQVEVLPDLAGVERFVLARRYDPK